MSIPGPGMLMGTLFLLLRKTSGLGPRNSNPTDRVAGAAKSAINNNEEVQKQLQEQQKKTNS